jgi:hypothetical protein
VTRDTATLIEDIARELPGRSGETTLHQIISDMLTNMSNSGTGALIQATNADVWAGTLNKILTSDLLVSASALVALTDAANVALDWNSGLAFSLTVAGNRTLSNPTNGQPGTTRLVLVTQGSGGSHTLAYGDQYKFENGVVPTLSTAAAAVDILNILCVTTSRFYVFPNYNLS